MTTRKTNLFIALAVSILGLSALGGNNNQVTRPNKVWGHITIIVDLRDGSFEANGLEQQTHTGRTTHTVSGQMDLETGTILSGTGVLTAANGDEIFIGVGPYGEAIVTGGTGRFDGLKVTWTNTTVYNENVIVEWPFLIRSYDWMGEGTITY